MKYLDGKRLRRAVSAGSRWLSQNRENLNAINVFPVADGDTGTNMALTLRAAESGANATHSNALADVADSIALHSLRGARGNSGVILSQFFKGIADFSKKKDRIRLEDFAGIFSAGADSAYSAINEPKEGTILTVFREMADHIHAVKDKFHNITGLLESALDKGKISLQETKEKLKVLKDAGVVDAGAQGFVHFIEGIYHFIKTGDIGAEAEQHKEDFELPEIIEEQSKFRYCSEYFIKGPDFNLSSIKNHLKPYGDSIIAAAISVSNSQYLRIHIHTDSPDEILSYAKSLGSVEDTKVDDMKAQNKSMRILRMTRAKISKKVIRIVTDSTSDLPSDLADFYGIEIIPLSVIFGTDTFLDGVDLDRALFYQKLRESKEFPKTSQPNPDDIARVYKSILDRGDCDSVLSIHVSSKLSGTLNSAIQAGKEFNNKITCFDSGSVTLGLGLMAITSAKMARDNQSMSKILRKLEEMRKNQNAFFTLGSVDYLIKGGRVGKAKGFLGKMLGLKPILTLKDGVVLPVGKARNEQKILEKILAEMPENLDGWSIAAGHANDPDKVEMIINALKSRCDSSKILTGEIGPTVGSHAGPGSWGLFYTKG